MCGDGNALSEPGQLAEDLLGLPSSYRLPYSYCFLFYLEMFIVLSWAFLITADL